MHLQANSYIILFWIAGIVIGIFRAMCESYIWEFLKASPEKIRIDNPAKYHTSTLLQYFGVAILAYASMLYGKTGPNMFVTFLILPAITFCGYYYLYCKVFNKMLGRKWFLNKKYVFSLFGKDVSIKYIPEKLGLILAIGSLLLTIFIGFL